MSDTSLDPFTQANKAIFDALMAFPQFGELVRVGNRFSSVKRTGAVPLTVNKGSTGPSGPADFLAPASLTDGGEIRVTQSGFLLSPFGSNSKVSEAEQTYDVGIATDSPDATRINRLKWFGLRALLRAGSDLGLPFVRGWTISQASESNAKVEENRQAGWSTAFSVNVAMYWTRANL